MFTRLLIAVDGSECSTRAAKYGFELAKRYEVPTDVVHVNEDEDEGREILDEATDFDVEPATDVETHLLEGKPASAISDLAADREADLIVMGRRGRTGIEEKVLGSVTERVLRNADAPVLTVPNGEISEATGTAYDGILLTTDGSDVAERAAPYGGDLASTLDATLHLLTVVDVKAEAGAFDAGGVSEEFVERLEEEGEEALDRLREQIDAEVDIESALVRGETPTAIDEYVSEHGIDLLAMASEGEANLVGQHIGSTANEVLRTVNVPVLVIPVPD